MKQRVRNYLVKKLSFLLYQLEGNKLAAVKALPNVSIADSVLLGQDTGFYVEGTCKTLTIEEKVTARKFCNFLVYPYASLIIHQNVFFNNYCSINCLEKIEIGENTMFGEGVKIYDHNHSYSRTPEILTVNRDGYTTAPVSIGKNCWIASNVTILKGVTIGDNVIIGANCLIHQSIPANSVVKHKEDLIIQTQ